MNALEKLQQIRAMSQQRVLDAVMDKAEPSGVMARLKLIGELARLKKEIAALGTGPAAAMKKLKLLGRVNQVRLQLGGKQGAPAARDVNARQTSPLRAGKDSADSEDVL